MFNKIRLWLSPWLGRAVSHSSAATRPERRRKLALARKEQKRKHIVQFYCPVGWHEYTLPGAPWLPPFVKTCSEHGGGHA